MLAEPPFEALRRRFEAAFVDLLDFERFLREKLGKRLDSYASASDTFPTAVFRVIKAADAEGWIDELVGAANLVRPRNQGIAGVTKALGVDVPLIKGKKQNSTSYYWTLLIGFLIFSLYPVSILLLLGFTGDALRWIKHEPAHNLFCLFLLPLAMALFSKAFNYGVFRYTVSQLAHLSLPSLLLLLMAAMYMGIAGAPTKQFAEPFSFTDSLSRVTEERLLRDGLETNPNVALPINSFSGWSDLIEHASFIVYVSMVLDTLANMFALFFLWYLVALIYVIRARAIDGVGPTGKVSEGDSWCLLVSFSLLIAWFPMRIYSEWYASFYHLKHILQYMSFWTFAILAFFVQLTVWFQFTLGSGVRSGQAVYAVLIFIICVVSILNDVLLRAGFFVLSSLQNIEFFLTYSLVVGLLLVLIPLLTPSTATPNEIEMSGSTAP